MDKLRSTLKQLVRDWSTEVYISFLPAFSVSWILFFFSFPREGRSAKRAMGP